MIHAFLLFVFLDGKLVSNDLYFRNLDECLSFSVRIARQGKAVTSYCLPKFIDPKKVRVY